MKGILRTRVGYCGGDYSNPTYYDIGDHSETIQIDFDPNIISYKDLLQVFWTSHSPSYFESDKQYMSAIWYHDEEQKILALKTASEQPDKVYTVIEPFKFWTNAEYYHQKYLLQMKPGIMEMFSESSQEEFINSELAAKLNGFVNGHLNLQSIKEFLKHSKDLKKVLEILGEDSSETSIYCSRKK
eukprot:gene9131-1220_t